MEGWNVSANITYKEKPNVNIRIKKITTKIKISLNILNSRMEMTEKRVSEFSNR